MQYLKLLLIQLWCLINVLALRLKQFIGVHNSYTLAMNMKEVLEVVAIILYVIAVKL